MSLTFEGERGTGRAGKNREREKTKNKLYNNFFLHMWCTLKAGGRG